ncbi:MAG: hypothetical protein RIE58_07750 [Vicingaceae bacterium]
MKKEERILTMHPQGKKGVHIALSKYDLIKDFILKTVQSAGEITHVDLNDLAVDQLTSTFDGKVVWYIVTVKLDLEARGLIERIPKTSPHKLRMRKK